MSHIAMIQAKDVEVDMVFSTDGFVIESWFYDYDKDRVEIRAHLGSYTKVTTVEPDKKLSIWVEDNCE